MNELALFAGGGGGLLASNLLGWNTVCAVEIEKYPRRILHQRQRDGLLEKFPIWDDIRTFDGRPWNSRIGIITGGFPCQDISCAGKGVGITGKRSGLWKEYARIIDEVRPRYVFAENVPMLRTRGLDVVLEDLAGLGYDASWGVLGAWHVGGNHKRNRMWVLAHTYGEWEPQPQRSIEEFRRRAINSGEPMDNTYNNGLTAAKKPKSIGEGSESCEAWPKQAGKSERLRASIANARLGNLSKTKDVSNTDSLGFKEQRQPLTDEPQRCRWWETEPNMG